MPEFVKSRDVLTSKENALLEELSALKWQLDEQRQELRRQRELRQELEERLCLQVDSLADKFLTRERGLKQSLEEIVLQLAGEVKRLSLSSDQEQASAQELGSSSTAQPGGSALYSVRLEEAEWWIPRRLTVRCRFVAGRLEVWRWLVSSANYLVYDSLGPVFSRAPKAGKIPIPPSRCLRVVAKGSSDAGINAEVHLVEYGARGKIRDNVISLNAPRIVSLHEETSGLRLALKVAGRGRAVFESIDLWSAFPDSCPTDLDSASLSQAPDYEEFQLVKNWPADQISVFDPQRSDIEVTHNRGAFQAEFDVGSESVYLPLFEADGNLRIPGKACPIEVDPERLYSFRAHGKLKGDATCLLFVISFARGGKGPVESVPLNSKATVEFPEGTDTVRLALRVTGQGRLRLREISIFSRIAYPPRDYQALRATPLYRKRTPQDYRVACILDPFTMHCFQPECQLIPFRPDTWRAVFSNEKIDFLLVESAWEGNDGVWRNKVARNATELKKVLRFCKERGIPTAFWNKEDPVHFDSFVQTAKLFDYIFTTDSASIPRYLKDVDHRNVYALPFAAQPRLHNPIEILPERRDSICFAGSYYREKFSQRQRDLEDLFEISEPYQLVIYDRNYGKDNPDFAFPAQYQQHIVGRLAPSEIDIAYKGHKFAINVNSVTESPTMFARRVFELLASNTPVLTSYSFGIAQLLPGLTLMDRDLGKVAAKLGQLSRNSALYKKFRLEGLREVLSRHTYAHRFGFILEVMGLSVDEKMPLITVVASPSTPEALERVLGNYRNQTYSRRELLLVGESAQAETENIQTVQSGLIGEGLRAAKGDWLAWFGSDDFYGPNYLMDLVLATKYVDAPIITKATRYEFEDGKLELVNPGQEYRFVSQFDLSSSLAHRRVFRTLGAEAWESFRGEGISEEMFARGLQMLSIDSFNHCRKLHGCADGEKAALIDQVSHDAGMQSLPGWDSGQGEEALGGPWFVQDADAELALDSNASGLRLTRRGTQQGPAYLVYGAPGPLAAVPKSPLYESRSPGNSYLVRFEGRVLEGDLAVQLFVIGYSKSGQVEVRPYQTGEWGSYLPDGQVSSVNVALRTSGRGRIQLDRISLREIQAPSQAPQEILACHPQQGRYLVLTNIYPSAHSLYRNGFVHRRVKAYLDEGLSVDVFACNPKACDLKSYEHDGVRVFSGDSNSLRSFLQRRRYRKILIHFLDESMFGALESLGERPPLVIWIHGFETESWHRRWFDMQLDSATHEKISQAIQASRKRTEFMNSVYTRKNDQINFVFVSNWFKESVAEVDANCLIENACTIPNVIDEDLFAQQEKPPELRKRILSIRPYASRKYGNDLAVRAILELSKADFFSQLRFTLIGQGRLFEETLEPVRGFSNVRIEERFLSQEEIVAYHRKHGVFLCPTRFDSQGVSMCEAMSSGLVPVTNRVAAIGEFVDDGCAWLAEAESHSGLADGIRMLWEHPKRFVQMSKEAARRVRSQCGKRVVIEKEISLIES